MRRNLFAALAGGLFGVGLVMADMTNSARVQAWLDVFGAWDPTLAFVLGGAILPMALAWPVARRRRQSVLGSPMPALPRPDIGADLVVGSALFGIGWGLVGLCPGPAIAVLSFGGWPALLFIVAMIAGMVATPAIRPLFGAPPEARGNAMDIRPLTPDYAVSPQISPEDLPAIKAAGFTTVIDNRPDAEIPADLQTEAMRRAAEAAGLSFVANPVIGGAITDANAAAQKAAIAAASGPVLAYCASGNRSSVVWAMARAGAEPTDDLIGAAARFGYNLEPFRARIDGLAAQG